MESHDYSVSDWRMFVKPRKRTRLKRWFLKLFGIRTVIIFNEKNSVYFERDGVRYGAYLKSKRLVSKE